MIITKQALPVIFRGSEESDFQAGFEVLTVQHAGRSLLLPKSRLVTILCRNEAFSPSLHWMLHILRHRTPWKRCRYRRSRPRDVLGHRERVFREDMHTPFQLESPKGDLPGGPVVKNPPSQVGDTGSIRGLRMKIPRAAGQLSHVPPLLSPCATTNI